MAKVLIGNVKGADGSDGVGVSNVAVTYVASSSGTTTPTTGWSSSIPTVSQGQYLWTRTILTLSDGNTSTSYSVAYQGADGADGSGGSDDYSDVSFATSDWGDVMEVIRSGKAPQVFSLTDERTISFGNGKSLTLIILGFNHDIKVSGGFAPITLGIKQTTGDYYTYDDSNSNIWADCTLRNDTLPALMELLPEEIQECIIPVYKYTQTGGGDTTVIRTEETLFPLSATEIYGNKSARVNADGGLENDGGDYCDEPYTLEGEQYAYYKAVKDGETMEGRIKYTPSGSADYYWTRTPYADGSDRSLIVFNLGCVEWYYATRVRGVSFGFCVG